MSSRRRNSRRQSLGPNDLGRELVDDEQEAPRGLVIVDQPQVVLVPDQNKQLKAKGGFQSKEEEHENKKKFVHGNLAPSPDLSPATKRGLDTAAKNKLKLKHISSLEENRPAKH